MNGELPVFIRLMSSPGFWPDVTEPPELIQTHISWVILAGERAYKIKKPVRFDFVDFRSLAAREAACHEELRLNRRLAPALYERVLTIGGTPEAPVPDTVPAFEYAVVMRRFPQSARLDHRLTAGRLSEEDLRRAADMLATFHGTLEPAPADSACGTAAAIIEPFADTLHELGSDAPVGCVDRLDALHRPLEPVFAARKAAGFVRECHGDLHLANLIELDGRILAYDCLEFAPELRWIDVQNEAAFPFMDLAARDADALAWPFIDQYLLESGDYEGLPLLRYYAAYHAFVRAKIAKLSADAGNLARYRAAGERHLTPGTGALVLMHGFAGSGKTTVSGALVGALPAVHLRSDVERKRLAGLPPTALSGSGVNEGLYSPAATRRTYRRLLELAVPGAAAGVNVIVDAAFLAAAQREMFVRAARASSLPLLLVDCTAPPGVLETRVRRRAAAGRDASEADSDVLAHQLAHADPLRDDEGFMRIPVDTAQPADAAALAASLRGHGARR